MPSRKLSAGAGFAKGFAEGLTERLRAKREEQERIREEERTKARMLEFLTAQTVAQQNLETHRQRQELATYKAKQEFEYGPTGKRPLFERKQELELEHMKAVGEVELDLAIKKAEELGDLDRALALKKLKAEREFKQDDPASVLDQTTKKMELYTKGLEAALSMVNARRDMATDLKKFDFNTELERALMDVESAMGMQAAGVNLLKPPPPEVTEELYLAAIEDAVDATNARARLGSLLGMPGSPPASGRVKDYFMDKWGEPFEQKNVFPLLGLNITGGILAGGVGLARGLAGEPPLSESAKRFLPGSVERGFEIGHEAATSGMALAGQARQLLGPTARYLAGELSIEQWLEELYAELGILPATGEEAPPAPAAPAPAPPDSSAINPEDLPALEPGDPGYDTYYETEVEQ